MPSVEPTYFDLSDRAGLETAHIHAVAVRIGARHVERLDTANLTKQMACDAGAKSVGRQRFRTLKQPETRLGDNQVKESALAADRAVTLDGFDVGGRRDRKFYAAAMTPAAMFNQGLVCLRQDSRGLNYAAVSSCAV